MTILSLRAARRMGCLGGALLAAHFLFAQNLEPVEAWPNPPLDDITQRAVIAEHQPLAYQPVREADIFWEKRLWRIVDTREKMNLPFISPESPLFTILADAALHGDLSVYSTEDDHFLKHLSSDDVFHTLYKTDTIVTIDVQTGVELVEIVQSNIDWTDVKRFRLKESWFFDANTGTLRVRILGIAPMVEVRDENGEFRFEKPLFWVHYPSARPLLASHKAVTPGGNYSTTTTWEDIFEMRYFASTVTKENNIYDRRLQDYLSGTDMVMQAERIEDELFNHEQDMWSR